MKLKFVSESYEEMKLRHPEWNWEEAEEVSDEDLEAAADYYDKLTSDSEVNEAYGQKDLVRMEDIKTKAAGDEDKEIQLATTQAKLITKGPKAAARAEAAEAVFGPDHIVAQIFREKASELGASVGKASKGALAPVKAPPRKGEKLEREFKKRNLLPSERIGYKPAEDEGGGFSRGGGEGSVYQKLGIGRFSKAPETSNEMRPRPASIASIGSVDIGSGESKYFNVYDTWPDSTAEVWKKPNGRYVLVFTSGSEPIGKIGMQSEFRNDQSWQELTRDGYWKMVDYVPIKNLDELIRVYGKSLLGYTYK